MKIWKIKADVNKYQGLYLKSNNESEILRAKLDRGMLVDSWEPLVVERDKDKKKTTHGDIPVLWSNGKGLVVSSNTKEVINKKYKELLQFLPLTYNDGGEKFYILNNLNIIDCIDYEKSELKLALGKFIVDVNKYVFKENARNQPIFKIYLDKVINIDTFVNDEFKELIESSGLQGFLFKEVFDFDE